MRDIAKNQPLPKDWYILLCKPNQNQIAERHLARMPVEIFMPYHMVSVRVGGQFRLQRRPLFAGYFFVGGKACDMPWRRIRTTPGISQVLGSVTHGPSKVPREVVEGLVHRCDADGMLVSYQDLSVGDRIKIKSGPFAEFVSRVEKIGEDARIHALLDFMGAQRRVAVDAGHVTKLD
ncbi:transcriptional activator RfaH [Rhodobacteraceae bacterium 63075]|nr:transcriptional activator RfaH [Rhodobacteraceae bacterium 63075]